MFHVVMVNLGDVAVNDALELTSEDFSSSARVKNPLFLEIMYGLNSHKHFSNVSHVNSGSGFDSSGGDGDTLMSDISIQTVSLAYVKFIMGLVLYEIMA